MKRNSLLFSEDVPPELAREDPEFFRDLNLDQIVDAIIAGRETYELRPFFCSIPAGMEDVSYRQSVMRDLERRELFDRVLAFSHGMRGMRAHLARAEKIHHKPQTDRWFLEAVRMYCDSVERLAVDLHAAPVASTGLTRFRDALDAYAASPRFSVLAREAERLEAELSAIQYTVLVHGDLVVAADYEPERDYSDEIADIFARFKDADTADYRVNPAPPEYMDSVEERILDLVVRLNPRCFEALAAFRADNGDYVDDLVRGFDREVQFYLAYLEYLAPLREAGLSFTYPTFWGGDDAEVYDRGAFDLALARKLLGEKKRVVCNDFGFDGKERILVVSGPNQGGKTTFARAFGQAHYLARLGCAIPGTAAQLPFFDNMFTHFEREEDPSSLRGKLEDDLIRLRDIVERATDRSVVILNEIFTSTTLEDALFLSTETIRMLVQIGGFAVVVSFINELASLGPQTVSMVATIVPDDPTLRTYEVVRRAADGLSYAKAIAEKYRLTYDDIRARLRP